MKKLFLSILIIICLSFQASAWSPMVVNSGKQEAAAGKATPTYDASFHSNLSSTPSLTIENVDPTGSNSNKIAIITIGWEHTGSGTSISSVTYDGNACTLINGGQYHASTYNYVYQYYYLNPSDTAKNVVVTLSTTVTAINVGVSIYYNVKQQAPEVASSLATGSSTTPSASVNTVTDGSLVIGASSNIVSTEDMTPDAAAETFEETSFMRLNEAYIIDETHGSQAVSWTSDGSTLDWGAIACAFEAADL